MKTAVKVTRTTVTLDEMRERVRAFEQQHPGINRDNYVDYFRDEAGELVESPEFFQACRLYVRLDHAESAQ